MKDGKNNGYRNSGDCNSGNYNTGDCNSGNYNIGGYNSGYYNSGDYNSGHYNTGNSNSGIFNTNEPNMRSFNKETNMTYSEFREKFGYKDFDLPLCSWILGKDMTDGEKKDISGWKTVGGYLRTLSYKEAWQKAWEEASEDVRDWYKSLPNFDADIFFEITGVDVRGKTYIKER